MERREPACLVSHYLTTCMPSLFSWLHTRRSLTFATVPSLASLLQAHGSPGWLGLGRVSAGVFSSSFARPHFLYFTFEFVPCPAQTLSCAAFRSRQRRPCVAARSAAHVARNSMYCYASQRYMCGWSIFCPGTGIEATEGGRKSSSRSCPWVRSLVFSFPHTCCMFDSSSKGQKNHAILTQAEA